MRRGSKHEIGTGNSLTKENHRVVLVTPLSSHFDLAKRNVIDKTQTETKSKREQSHAEPNYRWSNQREAEKDHIILRSGCYSSNFIFTAANTLALGSVMSSDTNDCTGNDVQLSSVRQVENRSVGAAVLEGGALASDARHLLGERGVRTCTSLESGALDLQRGEQTWKTATWTTHRYVLNTLSLTTCFSKLRSRARILKHRQERKRDRWKRLQLWSPHSCHSQFRDSTALSEHFVNCTTARVPQKDISLRRTWARRQLKYKREVYPGHHQAILCVGPSLERLPQLWVSDEEFQSPSWLTPLAVRNSLHNSVRVMTAATPKQVTARRKRAKGWSTEDVRGQKTVECW